jgi:hypothetical protein
MANSEELIGTTEYLTLKARCRINRYRYNRVQLYFIRHCFPDKLWRQLSYHNACYILQPAYRHKLNCRDNTWCRLQLSELPTAQFYPTPCNFLSLKSTIPLSALLSNILSLCSALNAARHAQMTVLYNIKMDAIQTHLYGTNCI